MRTRDVDIRKHLHSRKNELFGDDANTLIVDELSLCQGEARIDMAIINGSLHGIEIKSERDSLDRLPSQAMIYSKVMDTVTIIAGKNHANNINELIPEWWGIKQARANDDGEIYLVNIRESQVNCSVDPYSLAQLLWKDEALDILKNHKLEKGMISKPRKEIWLKLAENLPLNILQQDVRKALKLRENWRFD